MTYDLFLPTWEVATWHAEARGFTRQLRACPGPLVAPITSGAWPCRAAAVVSGVVPVEPPTQELSNVTTQLMGASAPARAES
jgi:hypothetical protein